MTTTMLDTGTTRTPSTDALRLVVDAVLLSAATDDDTDRYSGHLPAGRALLSLATLARRAAAALGTEPGVTLTTAPGIVVQRELAAAARLLDEAAEAAHGESWEIADLLVRAERVQAQLR
ncbi:hypothetical protein GCM10010531_29260 [Blastococcus jejuensis]|uniref:Uncharacterized protein n=1 Tax=Blastococcus jejuensis TaxID=351224 RepID=A0ABP6PBX6_9ACTN